MEKTLEQVLEEYNEGLRELLTLVREMGEVQRQTRDLMADVVNGGHIRSAVGMIRQHEDVKRVLDIKGDLEQREALARIPEIDY